MLQDHHHLQIVNSLVPRRQEMFNIIADHPYLSFDSLARRFPRIPRRTLAYDLFMLLQAKLVRKHGVTRGACYTVLETSTT